MREAPLQSVSSASSESLAERAAFRVAIVVSIGLHVMLAWPLVEGKIYTYDDLSRFHLPMRHFYAQCLADGTDTAWNPNLYCGFFLAGEGQVGMMHPWHAFLYRVLPLPCAFMIELVASYPILQLGLYWLLRSWPIGRAGAAFGSMLFTFSGSLLLRHVHMNAIATLAHVPWMMWSATLILRGGQGNRRIWWAGPLLALLTASELLIGYPQFVFYGIICEIAYIIILIRCGVPTRGIWSVLAAKVLGVFVAAVQVVPLLAELESSVRSSVIASLGITRPWHWMNLVQWFCPYLFRARGYFPEEAAELGQCSHEASLYLGAVTPALLTWLAFRGRTSGSLRVLARGMGILAGCALVLTFVEATPLIGLYRGIPGLQLLRVSARYYTIVQFAVAIIAAVAFHGLVRDQSESRHRLWVFAMPPLAAAACSAWIWMRTLQSHPEDLRLLAPVEFAVLGVGLSFCASLLVAATARGAAWAAPCLIVFTAMDLGAYGLSFIRAFSVERYESLVASLPVAPDRAWGHRIRMSGLPIERATDIMTLSCYRLVGGYAGLIPRRALDESNANAARVAGVGWSLDYGTGNRRRSVWTRLANPLPRVRLVSQAIASANPEEDLSRIDPAVVALVPSPIELPVSEPGTARLEIDEPGRVRLDVSTPARQLVVFSERFHEGWNAAVNGRPASILRCYGDFMGVVVERGHHSLNLRFEPASVRVGSLCSMGALALVAVWAAAAWRWPGRAAAASVSDPAGR